MLFEHSKNIWVCNTLLLGPDTSSNLMLVGHMIVTPVSIQNEQFFWGLRHNPYNFTFLSYDGHGYFGVSNKTFKFGAILDSFEV
jgi:hypothetical protein